MKCPLHHYFEKSSEEPKLDKKYAVHHQILVLKLAKLKWVRAYVMFMIRSNLKTSCIYVLHEVSAILSVIYCKIRQNFSSQGCKLNTLCLTKSN